MKWLLAAVLSALLLFPVLNWIFPFRSDIEYSKIVVSSNEELLSAYLTSDDKWRMYTALDEITPTLKKAIVHKEDKYFYWHLGINPISVARAIFYNTFTGKRTSGASTITMQVVRLLKPKERTYFNKLFEMFQALQLEWQLSKDEILQLYLNMVPYGGNIEGVKSASVLFFDKMPNHLSLGETTVLAIVPNRPSSLRLGVNNEYVQQERDLWLNRYLKEEIFDSVAVNDAKSEKLNVTRLSVPHRAPHLSNRLKKNHSLPIVKTHLDFKIQSSVERITKNYVKQLYRRNIKNAAVMVVENRTMKVKAYIGSADFFNPLDAGQVDGIRAVRSPGSTLKPFLYGLAIDHGLVTPKIKLSDTPVNFKGYKPQNYNETFSGLVSMEYALAKSLNIPAVKVLDQLQPNIFIEALAKHGFKQVEEDKKHLGLSTVLGGCGVTLEELTRLYSGFANHGVIRKLVYTKDNKPDTLSRALSRSANYMISEVLTDVVRPDLPDYWQKAENLPKIAWKTGTSYGRRDAWSIGFNQQYTIGVWVGNFSGQGVQELTGADVAAPLLFRIFNSIDRASSKSWFKMPKGVSFRHVCTETGMPPNDFCQHQIIDYFVPGVSDYQKCHHMKYVHVSADSTVSYCTTCLPKNGYVKALYPNHRPEMIAYYEKQQINYIKIPRHSEACERVYTNDAPKITSPVDQLDYLVDKEDSLQIMLNCQAAGNVSQVFWYLNDQFYQAAQPSEKIYFTPNEGKVKISCVDDRGRNHDVNIQVKLIRF